MAPLRAAILSSRRRIAPFGLAGGADGACGRNYIVRANGTIEELPGTAEFALAAGDRIVIETLGGGGRGTPDPTGQVDAFEGALRGESPTLGA